MPIQNSIRYRKARAENSKVPFTWGAFEFSARAFLYLIEFGIGIERHELKIRRRLLHKALKIGRRFTRVCSGSLKKIDFGCLKKFRVRIAFECVFYSREYGISLFLDKMKKNENFKLYVMLTAYWHVIFLLSNDVQLMSSCLSLFSIAIEDKNQKTTF